MRKNIFFSFLNIGGFAVGFAACMVIALFAYKEYRVDKDYAGYKHLYRVIDAKNNTSRVDYDIAAQLKDRYPEIIAAIPLNYKTLGEMPFSLKKETGEDFVMIHEIVSTTNDFFKSFSVKILVGDPIKPFADLNSLVLTKTTALKLFGKTDVVGMSVNIGDYFTKKVSAVSEDLPANASIGTSLFYNAENEKTRLFGYNGNKGYYNPGDLYVKLGEGVDERKLASDINANMPVNKSETDSIRFQPLSDIYLNTGINGDLNKKGSSAMIRIFLSIALLIMLLSIINYVNYSLSKQLATLKEIAIKITNGAGSRNIRSYYLIDVTLSVIIAYILALGIVRIALPYAGTLLNSTLDFNMLFTPVLMSIFLGILMAVVLISSFVPLYVVSKFDVQKLFGKKGSVQGKQFWKKLLTVFQFVTAILLLIGSMVIQKQLHFVKTSDIGFEKERLVWLRTSELKEQDVLKQRMDDCPFVKGTSFSWGTPGRIPMRMANYVDGKNIELQCMAVDDQFLKTFNIKLLHGRTFLNADKNVSCYFNETAFKEYGWKDLYNKRFYNGREGGYKVVGVVQDFSIASLLNQIPPVALLYNNDGYRELNIKLIPGDLSKQMDELRRIWKEVSHDKPMFYSFYDEYFNSFYQKEEQQGKSLTALTLLAFLITCMGLTTQIFQSCQARTKEIGVRKVNGAKISEVMALLTVDFAKLVLIANVIAIPIAYFAMEKWLEPFAYKTVLSWWIFAMAGIISFIIAMFTVSWQSWKAATRNPVESLRNE